jgi:hypothetical protein
MSANPHLAYEATWIGAVRAANEIIGDMRSGDRDTLWSRIWERIVLDYEDDDLWEVTCREAAAASIRDWLEAHDFGPVTSDPSDPDLWRRYRDNVRRAISKYVAVEEWPQADRERLVTIGGRMDGVEVRFDPSITNENMIFQAFEESTLNVDGSPITNWDALDEIITDAPKYFGLKIALKGLLLMRVPEEAFAKLMLIVYASAIANEGMIELR